MLVVLVLTVEAETMDEAEQEVLLGRIGDALEREEKLIDYAHQVYDDTKSEIRIHRIH